MNEAFLPGLSYSRNLASTHFRKLKRLVLKRADGRCERCKLLARPLHVHHLTYERLGNERIEDLKAVCKRCHEIEDEVRAKRSRARSESARETAMFNSGLDTYARKKYGDNWQELDWQGYNCIETEFNEWLDSKDEQEANWR